MADQRPPAYLQTVLGALNTARQPQLFFEDPTTARLPTLAQVLAAASAVTRQARQHELMANLHYLTSLVARGELRGPEQVAALNLPDPLIEAAILASQRVRNSPEYQESQIAPPGSAPSNVVPWDLLYGTGYPQARDQAEPTPEAQTFQEIAQRFPTIFAASSPQTTDIGVPSQEREEVGALVQFLLAWLTRRGGTSPGSEPAERPHEQMTSQM